MAQSPPVHNSTYYLNDGDVVFQVASEIFRVHGFLLRRHSATMADMLTMPVGDNATAQGRSDQDPIIIPAVVSARDFELLCSWLYRDLHAPDGAADTITLLHLSDFWQMSGLHSHMSTCLTTLDDESIVPSRRIFLCRRYHVTDHYYIYSSFRQLTTGTVDSLTVDDHVNLGIPIVRRLTSLFARLDRHRISLAAHPPNACHVLTECSVGIQRSQCEGHWVDYWNEYISPMLRNDANPARGPDIIAFMKSRRGMPFLMVTACMRLTFETILDDDHVLMADVEAIEADIVILAALALNEALA